jgi:hypothetical protein
MVWSRVESGWNCWFCGGGGEERLIAGPGYGGCCMGVLWILVWNPLIVVVLSSGMVAGCEEAVVIALWCGLSGLVGSG